MLFNYQSVKRQYSLEECLIICDETTIALIGFLKVGQVSESSECHLAKSRRTR